MPDTAPLDCIVQRAGRRPIVVVAPHGGRRERALKRGDGINDLHTADIALELAERLDAYAIVNRSLDRNDVDLNRISELAERAPGVLTLLCETVRRAGADACVPLVLLVHGWNVSSLHCDIGVGLREIDGELVGEHPTISRATLDSFVVPLRAGLERRGLGGLMGLRYPASAADNVTQLFSGRHVTHVDSEVAQLSRLAADGRVEAVQLEISIALRWPGRHREALVDALVEAVLAHVVAAEARPPASSDAIPASRSGWATARASDVRAARGSGTAADFAGESISAVLADGSGLFMAVEPADRRSIAARVCIARPDGNLALFVCEAPRSGVSGAHVVAGGLGWKLGGSVRFAGPAVLYPTNDAFLDLEQGLRGAKLADVELEVGHEVREMLGRSAGYIRINETMMEVSGQLVRRVGGRLGGGPPPLARLFLVAPELESPLIIEQRGSEGPARVSFEAAGRELIAAHPTTGELHGVVTVRVPVFRPTGDGRYLKIVFGVVELDRGARAGGRHALFESIEVLPLSA